MTQFGVDTLATLIPISIHILSYERGQENFVYKSTILN